MDVTGIIAAVLSVAFVVWAMAAYNSEDAQFDRKMDAASQAWHAAVKRSGLSPEEYARREREERWIEDRGPDLREDVRINGT